MSLAKNKTKGQVVVFVVVGTIAFCVDIAVLTLGISAGLDRISARFPAVIAAICTTWLLNRRFTFATRAKASWTEFSQYFGAMLIGLCVNLSIYAMLVHSLSIFHHVPQIAAFIGVLAGMTVNFLFSRRILDR